MQLIESKKLIPYKRPFADALRLAHVALSRYKYRKRGAHPCK